MTYSYKDDLDRFNEKKNDGKKLTLNSLNLASDAGLEPTYGGDGSGGGGSEDSPVKAADVRFTTDDKIVIDLSDVFPRVAPTVYFPGDEEEPAQVMLYNFEGPNTSMTSWNARMDDGMRLVAPQGFLISDGDFDVSVVSGSAEIIEIGEMGDEASVLYITGDCTIQISDKVEAA